MKIYSIIHKDTRKTLKEYSKLKEIEYLDGYNRKSKDFSRESLTYILGEKGTPGFFYYIPWEGCAVYWLSNKDWEIVWKD